MEHLDLFASCEVAQKGFFQRLQCLEERCLSFERELAKSAGALKWERQKLAEAYSDANQLRLELEKEQQLAAGTCEGCTTCSIEADARYEAHAQELNCRLQEAEARMRLLEKEVRVSLTQFICRDSSALHSEESQEDIREQSELLRLTTHQCQQLKERNKMLEENQQACRFCRDRLARAENDRLSEAQITPAERSSATESKARTGDTDERAVSSALSNTPLTTTSAVAHALSRDIPAGSPVTRPALAKSQPSQGKPYTNLELAKLADLEQDGFEVKAPRPSSEIGHKKSTMEFKDNLELKRPSSESGHNKKAFDPKCEDELELQRPSSEQGHNKKVSHPKGKDEIEPTRTSSELGHTNTVDSNFWRATSNCSTRASTRLSERTSLTQRMTPPKVTTTLGALLDNPSLASDSRESSNEILKAQSSSDGLGMLQQENGTGMPPIHDQHEKLESSQVPKYGEDMWEKLLTPLPFVQRPDVAKAEANVEAGQHEEQSRAQRVQTSSNQILNIPETAAETDGHKLPSVPVSAPVSLQELPDQMATSSLEPLRRQASGNSSFGESSASGEKELLPMMVPHSPTIKNIDDEPADGLGEIKRRSSLGEVLIKEARRRSEERMLGFHPQPGGGHGAEAEARRGSGASEASSPSSPKDVLLSPKTPQPKRASLRPRGGNLELAGAWASAQQLGDMLEERHLKRIENIEDPEIIWGQIEVELYSRRVLLANVPQLDARKLIRDFMKNLEAKRIERDRHNFQNLFRPPPPFEQPPQFKGRARKLHMSTPSPTSSENHKCFRRAPTNSEDDNGKADDDLAGGESSWMLETTGAPSDLPPSPMYNSEMDSADFLSEPSTPKQRGQALGPAEKMIQDDYTASKGLPYSRGSLLDIPEANLSGRRGARHHDHQTHESGLRQRPPCLEEVNLDTWKPTGTSHEKRGSGSLLQQHQPRSPGHGRQGHIDLMDQGKRRRSGDHASAPESARIFVERNSQARGALIFTPSDS